MDHNSHIVELSDPRDMTIDDPPPADPHFEVLKGDLTVEELAALVTVLAGARDDARDHGPQELNLWGHPVDKLRYNMASWQRVTLLERTHMRR